MEFVFKSKEFIKKLEWLVNEVPNKYVSGNGTWCKLDNGKWQMDCVVSVKGILWGFNGDKSKTRGGATYLKNDVKDFTCNGALKYCDDVSKDFSNITPGEYLCMKDTEYNHTGIYLGNGKVFECTTGWNVNKCIISDIDIKGTRSYKSKKNLKWTYHGKLQWIDYSDQKEEYEYNEIEPISIILNKDTNLWDLNFNSWNNVKSVEQFKKGDIFEVVATYKHKLGGVYYILESDYKKNHYGFNKVDCSKYEYEKIIPIEKIELDEIKDDNNTNTLPSTETSENKQENGLKKKDLLELILLIINWFKNLLKKD